MVAVALLLVAIGYIIRLKRQYRDVFARLDRLFDDAANSQVRSLSYDESIASALGERLIRALSAHKDHLAAAQDERNRIKSLISDLSHQMRTATANVLLYSTLLQESPRLDRDAAQHAEDIGAQAEKLRFLLDALEKMSRLEAGILTVVTKEQTVLPLLSGAVSEIYPRLSGKGIDLSVRADDALTAVFDLKWSKEAVCNILDNAVKYTEAGGSIRIEAVRQELFVRLDIADSGAGIPPEEYTDIFKRFYRSPRTREQDGIGVGLYIAREILTLQGGYVKVASTPGEGSVFSVYLPRRRGE
jgi:signal transduction histidine kinase